MQVLPQGLPFLQFFAGFASSFEQTASLAMHVLPQAFPVLQFFANAGLVIATSASDMMIVFMGTPLIDKEIKSHDFQFNK